MNVKNGMRVKIGGVYYTITKKESAHEIDHNGNGISLWGQIDYEKHSIRYRASCQERELRVILHEILHGLVEHGSIRELKGEHGEHLEIPIDQLANGLAEVLESIDYPLNKEV